MIVDLLAKLPTCALYNARILYYVICIAIIVCNVK